MPSRSTFKLDVYVWRFFYTCCFLVASSSHRRMFRLIGPNPGLQALLLPTAGLAYGRHRRPPSTITTTTAVQHHKKAHSLPTRMFAHMCLCRSQSLGSATRDLHRSFWAPSYFCINPRYFSLSLHSNAPDTLGGLGGVHSFSESESRTSLFLFSVFPLVVCLRRLGDLRAVGE